MTRTVSAIPTAGVTPFFHARARSVCGTRVCVCVCVVQTRRMLSDYLDEIVTTTTHDAYIGVPLATHSSSARGHILERVARRVMENKLGETACDPPSGVRVNGAKRGWTSETYDFMIGGRRVEVKSSQLLWNRHKKRWVAQWHAIKRVEYDILLLLLYTPVGVHLYIHDHTYGVSTRGKSQHARGGVVMVCGTCNEPSISAATDAIRAKLVSMHYATIGFSEFEDLVTTTTTHDAYDGVPLATHSSKARGDILERVAQRVMEKTMGETACDPPSGVCVNGAKRGRSSATYDFMIAGQRVEVKSSQLSWNSRMKRWSAQWQDIKRVEYDDLLLVLYTPVGVHLFLHDHTYGVSTRGKSQHACGGKVQVCGPKNEPSISVAMDAILKKMGSMHYASLTY